MVRLEIATALRTVADGPESMDAAAFNAALVGAIRVEAEYVGAAFDLEIRDAEKAVGRAFPAASRNYIQSSSWFRRG